MVGGALLAGIIFIITFFIFRGSPKEPFIAVAVAGDPVTVVYIDRISKRTSLISLPASTSVDACSGYGTYPIASLWRLGEIEKKGGTIFATSLGLALGIPIKYYIGPRTYPEETQDLQAQMSWEFNLLRIPDILVGRVKTNMSVATYLEVANAVTGTLPTATILDLSKTYALTDRESQDGTVVRAINPDGADLVFRQTHELAELRGENIRVNIINTTGSVGLGLKIARILSHVGITVVATESEDKIFDACEVTASRQLLSSLTVKTIVSYLSCQVRTSDDTGKADVVVRLGKADVRRF
jgi:hypothetical protein